MSRATIPGERARQGARGRSGNVTKVTAQMSVSLRVVRRTRHTGWQLDRLGRGGRFFGSPAGSRSHGMAGEALLCRRRARHRLGDHRERSRRPARISGKADGDGGEERGGEEPRSTPVFVVSTVPAKLWAKGVRVHYVTDGIASAIDQARAANGKTSPLRCGQLVPKVWKPACGRLNFTLPRVVIARGFPARRRSGSRQFEAIELTPTRGANAEGHHVRNRRRRAPPFSTTEGRCEPDDAELTAADFPTTTRVPRRCPGAA